MISKNKGIALFSVLLVASILAVFSTYYLSVTKQNQALIERIDNRIKAELLADSKLAELKLDIIRRVGVSTQLEQDASENSGFNYYGKPFEYAPGITATVQDVASLVSLFPLKESFVYNLLVEKGIAEEDAERARDCLLDWVDWDNFKHLNGEEKTYYEFESRPPPRNGQLMSVSELELVCGWNASLVSAVKPYLVPFASVDFYPVMAPKALLNAYYKDESLVENMLELRKGNSPNQIREQLDNSNALGVRYGLSGTYKISITAQNGLARANRMLVFDTNFQYKTDPPINTWHWSTY